MTAHERPGSDWTFKALATTRLAPGTRSEGSGGLRQTHREVGGHFTLRGDYVLATARPVAYRLTSSAEYEENDEVVDCTYDRPLAIDTFNLMIYPQRDRVAIRWSLPLSGWGCRHETTGHPSCGNDDGGDASVMFYKEIEFTRRWIKLPIDLQWRARDTVECDFRWNGYVRLKRLRDRR